MVGCVSRHACRNGTQVYDLRGGARMATSVAFNAGPALARFHPKFSSTLVLASLSGAFTLADANAASFQRYQQVGRCARYVQTVLFGSCLNHILYPLPPISPASGQQGAHLRYSCTVLVRASRATCSVSLPVLQWLGPRIVQWQVDRIGVLKVSSARWQCECSVPKV